MFSFTFDEKEYTLSEDKLLYFFNEDVEGFDIDKLFEILNSSEGVSFGKAYYDGPCEECKFGLEEKINILQGDCLEVLESLHDEFDMIFMDAGKGHYNHFLPECLRLLKKDGIIIADNVLFRGMVASDDLVKRRKITIVKRMRKYLDMVSKDENLITTVIPMGDGIALTKRR